MSRDNSNTRDSWEEPERESSYEAHLRRKRLKQRARQSKSNDANRDTSQPNEGVRPQGQYPDSPGDRNTRGPRQRPQSPRRPMQRPLPSEENDYPDTSSTYSRGRARMPEMYTEDMYDDDMDIPMSPAPPRTPPRTTRTFREPRPHPQYEEDYGAPPRQQRSRRTSESEWEDMDRQAQRPRSKSAAQQRTRPRNRSFGSIVLIGCIGGLVTIGLIAAILIVMFLRTPLGSNVINGITNKPYTQQRSQPLQITNLALAQIHNQVGNVSVTVSSSVTAPTLTTLKRVTASSSSAANSEFARINVSVQPVGSALTINATVPGQGNNSSGDSVDLMLTLPPASTGNASSSITFNIAIISGNMNVQQVALAAGSCLQTNQGNVTFNGTLDTSNGIPSVPCQSTQTNNPHPWYTFHSEVGNLDVTLPATTNITLDAATNTGSIDGTAFGLTIPSSDNSASYHGPLTGGSASPPAELKLDVGTGTIRLHKR